LRSATWSHSLNVEPGGFSAAFYPTFTPEVIQAAHVEVPGQAGALSPMNAVRGTTTLSQTQGREWNGELGFRSVRTFHKGV
jgi:hypothetical protein